MCNMRKMRKMHNFVLSQIMLIQTTRIRLWTTTSPGSWSLRGPSDCIRAVEAQVPGSDPVRIPPPSTLSCATSIGMAKARQLAGGE